MSRKIFTPVALPTIPAYQQDWTRIFPFRTRRPERMRSLAYLAKRLGEVTGEGETSWIISISLAVIDGELDHQTNHEHLKANGLSDLARCHNEYPTPLNVPPLFANNKLNTTIFSGLESEEKLGKDYFDLLRQTSADPSTDSRGIMQSLSHFDIDLPGLEALGLQVPIFKATDVVMSEKGSNFLWCETLMHPENLSLIHKVRDKLSQMILTGLISVAVLKKLVSDIFIDISDFLWWTAKAELANISEKRLPNDIKNLGSADRAWWRCNPPLLNSHFDECEFSEHGFILCSPEFQRYCEKNVVNDTVRLMVLRTRPSTHFDCSKNMTGEWLDRIDSFATDVRENGPFHFEWRDVAIAMYFFRPIEKNTLVYKL
jgi:hypothetical protein